MATWMLPGKTCFALATRLLHGRTCPQQRSLSQPKPAMTEKTVSHDPADYPPETHVFIGAAAETLNYGDLQGTWEYYFMVLERQIAMAARFKATGGRQGQHG